MSSIRSMKRQMVREAAQDAAQLGRLKCPKCGHELGRKKTLGKKVACPKCKWEGRTK